jgi:hypothetical protein
LGFSASEFAGKPQTVPSANRIISAIFFMFTRPHLSPREPVRKTTVSFGKKWNQRTQAKVAGISDDLWTFGEFLTVRLPIRNSGRNSGDTILIFWHRRLPRFPHRAHFHGVEPSPPATETQSPRHRPRFAHA